MCSDSTSMTRPSRSSRSSYGADLDLPVAAGDLEDVLQPVAGQLVGREGQEVVGLACVTSRSQRAEHPGGLVRRARPGASTSTPYVAPVRQPQVAQHAAAVGDRVGAHPPVAGRAAARAARAPAGRRRRTAPRAGRTAATARAPRGARRRSARRGQRHLVGAERALDLLAVDDRRAGPALRRAQHDHRPGRRRRRRRVAAARGPLLDRRRSGRGRCRASSAIAWCTVRRVVAGDDVRVVAVAAQQLEQLVLGDAGQQRRVGDLVLVEVRGSAAPRRRAPGRGTCRSASSSASGPVSASPSPTTQNDRRGRGCRAPRRTRAAASSRARRPRGTSPGVSGAQWLGTPPGKENWRKNAAIPRSSWVMWL